MYDDTKMSAEDCWHHFTSQGYQSTGVMAVMVKDCLDLELSVNPDGVPFDAHVSVDFSSCTSNNQIEKKAKKLRKAADQFGWRFQAE